MLQRLLLVVFGVVLSCGAWASEPVPGQPAPQSGEKLVQCVAFKWEVPGDAARIRVEVIVFGKSVAEAELDPDAPDMDFAFEDGFVQARGTLTSTYDEFGGTGELLLPKMTYACDFTGEYSLENRRVTEFEYLARFDY